MGGLTNYGFKANNFVGMGAVFYEQGGQPYIKCSMGKTKGGEIEHSEPKSLDFVNKGKVQLRAQYILDTQINVMVEVGGKTTTVCTMMTGGNDVFRTSGGGYIGFTSYSGPKPYY